MVEEYFQNSVQLLDNEVKRYITITLTITITLKIGKSIFPACDAKNSNRAFLR